MNGGWGVGGLGVGGWGVGGLGVGGRGVVSMLPARPCLCSTNKVTSGRWGRT